MNPFELRGPAFLAVYGGFAALILLGAVLTRRQLEADTIPKLPFVDPYLIACLRRGAPEAVRVALLSLLDRRLIEQKGDMLVARAGVVDQVRRPLEQRVLEGLQLPRLAHELSDDEALRAACAPLDAELVQLGLCVNPAQKLVRFVAAALALALLWLVAGTKISVALTRGVHNIGFLITLAGIASVLVVAVLAQRRTPVGDALLADLRTLFDGLKQRAASIDAGGASNELALLVGVFSVDALAGGLRRPRSASTKLPGSPRR